MKSIFGKIFLAFAALFAGTLFSGAAAGQNAAPPSSAWTPAYPESAQKRFPGRFVTALARGNGDDIWIATEKRGLFRMNHNEKGEWQWGSVRAGTPGFPPTKSFYALCRDGWGRIWAGTDSFGVAVFDGKAWRTFNRSNGFPGARVFSIACSPKNGDVAVAHDGGISVCAGTSGKWTHFSTLDGLPTNEPCSVRFAADGALWAGFSCGGVACASPENSYAEWTREQTAWHFGGTKNLLAPAAATGAGLPSNLVNAVCPLGDGVRVACGTVSGLAFTDENGAWSFLRGADFPAKIRLLLNGKPKEVSLPDAETKKKLLPEDFVTCLVETDDGLWAGTRRKGCVLLDPENGFAPKAREGGLAARQLDGAWVKAILPIGGETLLVGTYGNGLKTICGNGLGGEPEVFENSSGNAPAFVFPTPTDAEIAALRERLAKEPPLPDDRPWAAFLGDDWETRGNWCERYGQRYAVLCGVYAPSEECRHRIDFLHYGVRESIGRSARRDALRRWVHWINKLENENILFEPGSYMREEAEWDDHGEVYAFEQEGPDVWAFTSVPAGTQLVSLYFYNPNPEDWRAQYRDYFIEVRFQSEADTEGEVLARARVSDFAGSGVHKTFAVRHGDRFGRFAFRVCRNHSFNTILNGVFVSRLNEPRDDELREQGSFFTYCGVLPRPPELDGFEEKDFPADALALWRAAEQAENSALGLSARRHLRNLAYVSAKSAGTAPAEILENWRWRIGHWEASDKEKFIETMKAVWAAWQKRHLHANSADWFPYSPNVVPFTYEELRVMEHEKIDWKQYRPGGKPEISVEEMRERVRPLIEPYFEEIEARNAAFRKADAERRAEEEAEAARGKAGVPEAGASESPQG